MVPWQRTAQNQVAWILNLKVESLVYFFIDKPEAKSQSNVKAHTKTKIG